MTQKLEKQHFYSYHKRYKPKNPSNLMKNKIIFEAVIIVSILVIVAMNAGYNGVTGLYSGSYIGSLSISTEKTQYARGGFVIISSSLMIDKFPVSDADVSVNIVKPDGIIIHGNTRTGYNGMAFYNYNIRQADPSGLYTIIVTVYSNDKSISEKSMFMVE